MNLDVTIQRFRVLCNVCLVFDSLFLLLYFTTVLHVVSRATGQKPLTNCYQDSGWTWHIAVAATLFLSALVALLGLVVHAKVVCGGVISVFRAKSVSNYATALCIWILCSSFVQAVAYKQDSCLLSNEEPGASADFTHLIWQVVYMVLWLIWVTGNVAASVLARRHKAVLCELQQLSALGAGRSVIQVSAPSGRLEARPCPGMPQTVGMPVLHQLSANQASDSAGGYSLSSRGLMRAAPGLGGSLGVVQGMPVGGSPPTIVSIDPGAGSWRSQTE